MSPEIEKLLAGCTTVAAKIRALDGAGYARADIARILGKRYQHVRNVLEEPTARPSGVAERGRAFEAAPVLTPEDRGNGVFRLEVEADGSVRLPASVLDALGLKPGYGVVARLENGTFTLIGADETLRRVRANIPQWRPGEPLWSEELIEDRRREAEAEARDD